MSSLRQGPKTIWHSFTRITLVAGVVLLLMVLHLYRETPHLWLNSIIAAAGIVMVAACARPAWLESRLGRVAEGLGVRSDRLVLVFLGLLLSAAARSAAGDGSLVHSPTAVPLWLGGISLVMVGLSRKQERADSRRWPLWEVLLVLVLGLVSLWLRAWQAGSWPHVLSGDEGSVGMTAWEFRAGQRDNVLSLAWWSFPALYFWLVSLSQAVFGRTVEAIRWVSALGGALTVVALYAAARSMFGRPLAMWSALWLSGFHHHLFFSRVAYNNIWDGLFFIIAAGCIWHGRSHGLRSAYLWAGLALGLGQYFYTTSHLALLILGLWLILLHRSRPASPDPTPRGSWPDVACLALVTAAAVVPLALLYLEHPASLVYTSERVTLFAPGWQQVAETLGLTPLALVLEQMWVTALGLVVAELQGVYYAPGVPLLFSLSALFFVVGLIVCLLRLRDPRSALPLLTLAGTVVVGGLSIQAPNGQRMMLLPPMLALMVSLPLEEARLRLTAVRPRLEWPLLLSGTGLVAVMVVQNLGHFFVDYLPTEMYGSLNGEVAQEMAHFLAERAEPATVYFVGGERMRFDSFPSLFYLYPAAQGQDLAAPYLLPDSGEADSTAPIFIVLPEEVQALDAIERLHGPGQTLQRYNRKGQLLFIAFIPRATAP